MRLNDYDEFIEYVLDEFEIEDDITVVCNYDLARILYNNFNKEKNITYNSIQLNSEINEYYVSKLYNKELYVEPIKSEGKIQTITNNYFIVDGNILEDNLTLFDYLESCIGKDFEIEVIYYEEECDCCEDEKNNGLLTFEYVFPWMEKDRPSLEEAKFNPDYIAINNINDEDEEDICYLKLADLIEEYVGLILDNDCKEEVLGHALTEFAGKILENFCLEKIEE